MGAPILKKSVKRRVWHLKNPVERTAFFMATLIKAGFSMCLDQVFLLTGWWKQQMHNGAISEILVFAPWTLCSCMETCTSLSSVAELRD